MPDDLSPILPMAPPQSELDAAVQDAKRDPAARATVTALLWGAFASWHAYARDTFGIVWNACFGAWLASDSYRYAKEHNKNVDIIARSSAASPERERAVSQVKHSPNTDAAIAGGIGGLLAGLMTGIAASTPAFERDIMRHGAGGKVAIIGAGVALGALIFGVPTYLSQKNTNAKVDRVVAAADRQQQSMAQLIEQERIAPPMQSRSI